MSFYEHRGYTTYGATETMKYRELKMRKIFEVAMKKILIIGEGFCRALLSRKQRAWVMRH